MILIQQILTPLLRTRRHATFLHLLFNSNSMPFALSSQMNNTVKTKVRAIT